MGLVTEDAVRAVAAFKGKDGPVVSVYLDVDGRRHRRRQDYEASLARLLGATRANAHPSVVEDLDRIETYVRAGVDRSKTRGLALFACSAHRFLETLQLAVPVHNQIVVNHTPHVRQLEAVLNNHQRFGVLVVDRQRARMFVFEQGELVDRSETFEPVARGSDNHGRRDRQVGRGSAVAHDHAHVAHAAQMASVAYRQRPFDHLLIDVPADLGGALDRELSSDLRERVAARLTLPKAATAAQIGRAASEVADDIQRMKEGQLVTRFRAQLDGGGPAVSGLAGVLDALSHRRVETLLVSEGFVAHGLRCWDCDHVAARGHRCPRCGQAMLAVDDVVEEAVEVALGQSARVVTCRENADLDVHGRIGALLRF